MHYIPVKEYQLKKYRSWRKHIENNVTTSYRPILITFRDGVKEVRMSICDYAKVLGVSKWVLLHIVKECKTNPDYRYKDLGISRIDYATVEEVYDYCVIDHVEHRGKKEDNVDIEGMRQVFQKYNYFT